MGTGAIPLGGAGSSPVDDKKNITIPIPEALPNDPVVLIDGHVPSNVNDLPRGGLKDQVLKKRSNSDYDVHWDTDETGGDSGHDHVPEDTTINRDANDLIESVVTASKTVNITRDGDGQIVSVEDGEYQKDIIRTGGLISFIDVTKL